MERVNEFNKNAPNCSIVLILAVCLAEGIRELRVRLPEEAANCCYCFHVIITFFILAIYWHVF